MIRSLVAVCYPLANVRRSLGRGGNRTPDRQRYPTTMRVGQNPAAGSRTLRIICHTKNTSSISIDRPIAYNRRVFPGYIDDLNIGDTHFLSASPARDL